VRRNATGGNVTGDEFTSLPIINEHIEKYGYQLGINGDAFRQLRRYGAKAGIYAPVKKNAPK